MGNRFLGSVEVLRDVAQRFSMIGRHDEVTDLYNRALIKEPTNHELRKDKDRMTQLDFDFQRDQL